MTSRDRRAVLLGTTVVAVAWIGMRGVPGGLGWLETTRSTALQRAELVERGRARVRDVDTLADSLESFARIAESLPEVLLAGGDEEAAIVDLMGRVRRLVGGPRVRITAFDRLTETKEQSPLVLVNVTVMLKTDFQGLLSVITRIESDRALAIETVDVKAPAAHADREQPEILEADVVVSGWYRPVGAIDANNGRGNRTPGAS